MKYTENFNLKKPDGEEYVDIHDINGNMEILDHELGEVHSQITSTMPYLMVNKQTNKTYRYGKQINKNGKPQIIYEEVL